MGRSFVSSLASTPRDSNSSISTWGILTSPDTLTDFWPGDTNSARSSQAASLEDYRGEDLITSSDDESSNDALTYVSPQGPQWIPNTDTISVSSPPDVAQPYSSEPESAQTEKQVSNFSWKRVHLEGLYLLRTRYRASWNHTTEIFNELFQRHIREGRPRKWIRVDSLKTSYAERGKRRDAKAGKRAALWNDVLEDIKQDPQAFDLLKLEIEYMIGDRDPGTKAERIPPKPKVTYNKVPVEKAHPPIPSVLFRCYHDQSQGLNSSHGFSASYFGAIEEAPLPPAHHDFDLLHMIKMHMNIEHFMSPLISTSGSLARTIRRSLGDRNKATDPQSCRISVIDGKIASEGQRIFWAKPYKLELERKKKAFDRDKLRYKGSNEYLVWAHIPASAIIRDISLDELLDFCAGDHVLSYSIDMGLAAGVSWNNVRKRLQDKDVHLSSDQIAGLARLVSFLGLGIHSQPSIIARLISEIVQSWCLVLREQSKECWTVDAVIFARTLVNLRCTSSEYLGESLGDVCDAFLSGLRTSTRDWWSHFETDPGQVEKMERRTAILGLTSMIRYGCELEEDQDAVCWA